MSRNFQVDFCGPAMNDLSMNQGRRVGLALDVAILFGVLEFLDGNASLSLPRDMLERIYAEKVERLSKL